LRSKAKQHFFLFLMNVVGVLCAESEMSTIEALYVAKFFQPSFRLEVCVPAEFVGVDESLPLGLMVRITFHSTLSDLKDELIGTQ
jgi:hypothetical protein